ncbi:hypothetical protein [Membranihabitans maritimus]|uniref:hypothetical protein n=1 Tax=Membranihabitans maritimus TaxID=2904244 RepID=UPI001F2E25FD|nr:hypothetical protein [Membranihabitans maritimus]
MDAIKVTFRDEQEEKVLLSILDSLSYDYEPQYSIEEEEKIAAALKRSKEDFQAGRFSEHKDVMKRIKSYVWI